MAPPPCLLDGIRFAPPRPEEREALKERKRASEMIRSNHRYASKSLRFTPKFKEVVHTLCHVLRIRHVPFELRVHILDLCDDIRHEVICVEYRRCRKDYEQKSHIYYVKSHSDMRSMEACGRALWAAWQRLKTFE